MKRTIVLITFALLLTGCGDVATIGDNQPTETTRNVKAVRVLVGHDGRYVCDVAFTPDGTQLVSCGSDNKIKYWGVETGTCHRTIDGHEDWTQCLAISPDGKLLASGGRDKLVKLWDVKTGELVKSFEGHEEIVLSVAYSPDGSRVASSGSGRQIKIWGVESGTPHKTLLPDRISFLGGGAIQFTPDSKQIYYAGDGVQLWDIETRKLVKRFEGHTDTVGEIALSPSGTRLASAGSFNDDSIRFYDADTADCLWSHEFKEDGGSVEAVLFVAEDILVTGHFDGNIRYWNAESGEVIRTVYAHSDSVESFALSKKFLASCGSDSKVRLWEHPSKLITSN